MGPLRKKSWWQKLLFSRLTLGVLLLALLGLAFAVFDRYQVEREMRQRRLNAETELEKEKERKEVLEDRVDYLNNDQGLEAEIRRHFDVALPGEQVVVIVDNDDDVSATSGRLRVDTEENFWERWWPW